MLYAPRNIKVEPTEFHWIDSGILALIPKNTRGFVTLNFKEDEINEIWNGNQRVWVEILNKSCELPIEIKNGCVLGFFVAEPDDLKFQYKVTMEIKKVSKKKQTTLW